MNKVIITNARLTRDVEMRQTNNGMAVVQFGIAHNRQKRKGEAQTQADFFNCVAWNHTAEFIAKYFQKGSAINIEGHLAARSYENKQGQKVNVVEIVCDNVEFAGPKSSNQGGGFNSNQQNNAFNSFGGNAQQGGDEAIPF